MNVSIQVASTSVTTLDLLLGACQKLLYGFQSASEVNRRNSEKLTAPSSEARDVSIVVEDEGPSAGSQDWSFRRYLSDLRLRERLDHDQELNCFDHLRTGSESQQRYARDKIIQANLWIVPVIVRRFNRHGTGFEDLVAEGNLGLFRALDTFEPERGLRFSTYAKWWVINAVTTSMAANAYPLRLPKRVAQQLSKQKKDGGRVESREELYKKEANAEIKPDSAGLSFESTDNSYWLGNAVSISEGGSEYECEFAKLPQEDAAPQPDAIVAGKETANRLIAAVQKLPEKQRYVLERRYGLNGQEPMTLQELGSELGVSAERVRKVQNAAIAKLRSELCDLLDLA
jgi:RNA polymerase sigma factor (sigma-70 family)